MLENDQTEEILQNAMELGFKPLLKKGRTGPQKDLPLSRGTFLSLG
jgi:hypothetical protein